jgi:L-aspartate oxidase
MVKLPTVFMRLAYLVTVSYNEGMADVIIVGAGIAGLLCAHGCAQAGISVSVVHKGPIQHSSSSYAQGGIAAAWQDEDSVEAHIADTLMAGAGLCDADSVTEYCKQAPETVSKLMDLGVPFDTNKDGSFRLAREGAHSHARIFHVKDYTGMVIINTLMQQLEQCKNVQFIEGVVDGLIQAESSTQVCGVSVKGEELLAPHVVLATGGFSHIFLSSTNPVGNMGQGIALAYGAGAVLADLEFIQFHPTVYCKSGFPPLLISEALRGEGAFLVNKNNDRFMKDYHVLEDLAPRDIVSRAMVKESGPKLNIAPLMTKMDYRFPTILERLRERDFGIDAFEIPVQPLPHYTLGGIRAGMDGQTSLSGLYAIGECAATGFHGANRLASNSLLEAAVMGVACARYINQVKAVSMPKKRAKDRVCLSPLAKDDMVWLGDLCTQSLGVLRTADTLTSAIHSLDSHALHRHTMFRFVRAIINCAMHRNESRGGHYRSDATACNDVAKHSVIQRGVEVIHLAHLF